MMGVKRGLWKVIHGCIGFPHPNPKMVNIIFVSFRLFFFFLVFLCILKFQQFDSFWSVTFFVLFTFCLASFILLWFSSFSGNELEFIYQSVVDVDHCHCEIFLLKFHILPHRLWFCN